MAKLARFGVLFSGGTCPWVVNGNAGHVIIFTSVAYRPSRIGIVRGTLVSWELSNSPLVLYGLL